MPDASPKAVVRRLDPARSRAERTRLTVARGILRATVRAPSGPPLPVRAQRAWFRLSARANPPARPAPRADVEIGGRSAERVIGTSRPDPPAILYLHGGAYTLHTPFEYRPMTSAVALAASAVVYALDYRRAPEHPCPAAIDDALAAYRWLLDSGVPPERIALAGDSAGGGLSLATAVAIRDASLPEPAVLALISPWTDLTLSGETIRTKARVDPILRLSWLRLSADQYRGSLPADDARVSPLNADLVGLPPTLIQAGTEDMLASDAERIADRLAAAGVETELDLHEGLWHDFQSFPQFVPDATPAVQRLGAFIAVRCR